MGGYISKASAYKMICQLFELAFNLGKEKDKAFFEKLESFIKAMPEEKPE